MNTMTEQLIHDIQTLPPPLQQEVADFVELLKQKDRSLAEIDMPPEPNGSKLARLMEEVAAKNLFSRIPDAAVWQRQIRQDRPLPGRE